MKTLAGFRRKARIEGGMSDDLDRGEVEVSDEDDEVSGKAGMWMGRREPGMRVILSNASILAY